uniref:Wiskott-Aldrich syndrome protein family member n=1 Tax=Anopheles dirus TaxID=7168 RepID=A0A182NCD6_9DIPT
MPFVKRVVTPKYIARSSKLALQPYAAAPTIPVADNEFEALTNVTLSNALRQLASLVYISNQIFTELHQELSSVNERSLGIKQRIDRLSQKVEQFDPKQVTVPESDLDTFVQIKDHFKTQHHVDTALFTVASRSETVQELYEAAAKTPVATIAEMDRIMGNIAGNSTEAFICTPVLSRLRRHARAHNVDLEDIEVSLPTAVQDLRKWTSSEAIGDVTTGVACSVKIATNSSTVSNSVLPNVSENLTTPSDLTNAPTTANTGVDEGDIDAITTLAETMVASNSSGDDRVDHLLPSPAEQCRVLASKFPAETIKIDTSGRAFDRMSSTRKSLVCYTATRPKKDDAKPEEDTVRRRSRLRRPRGKRRNTIASSDQREIAEVISKGEPEGGTVDEHPVCDFGELVPAIRSKSGDLLRKEPSFSAEWAKSFNKMSHFNSLKQWGMNRLRMINRESASHRDKDQDIDDFNIHDTTLARQPSIGGSRRRGSEREKRLSHDRKPSYSSSERSSTGILGGTYLPASINPVKLRETSTIRRQRRTALGNRDEPHSSSGNWSASSESGRTSIGSEITTTNTHPKSSASSTSLNHSNPISSSAPPSSIVSRRRFFNTSASSSVTSEGTITPDLQTFDYHDEGGETSSVYSCDTEGYYTSFHVDSGLKTLKEEEPMTPLQSTTALSSITSFSSSGNTTVVSQDNDYELYGKGSTSTTTSSAGTICTVLAEGDKSVSASASNLPKIPERKSSLTKLNRSNSTASNGTLERSYSSSTLGSTLDSTGTIKRNGVLIQKEVLKILRQENNNRLDVADGNAPKLAPEPPSEESSTKLPPTAEPEHSESSDVECVERTERLKVKTTINTSRIPSMCIITPTNSDDEQQPSGPKSAPSKPATEKGSANTSTGSSKRCPALTESASFELKKPKDFRKHSLLPLNHVFDRIKGALPHLKKSPTKEDCTGGFGGASKQPEEELGEGGEYVEISKGRKTPNELTVRRNLATVLSGNLNEETEYVSLNELPCNIKCDGSNFLAMDVDKGVQGSVAVHTGTLQQSGQDGAGSTGGGAGGGGTTRHAALKGAARVKLDANGRAIFSSDSLKRRKGAHTTFAPGPCVKDVSSRETQCKQPLHVGQQQQQQQHAGGDGAVGTTVSTTNPPVLLATHRQLKRPLVSARYGAPRIGAIAVGSGAGGTLEPPKKTLVATILPNSAKQQQHPAPVQPPRRETRELATMHSFSPYGVDANESSASYYGGAYQAPVATPSSSLPAGAVGHAKLYPEGAHSLDRSSIRNWYPDKLTVQRNLSTLPATRPDYARTYRAGADYEPPRALMTGSFASPPASPVVPDASDPNSLYAIPNKPNKPSPLAVGRSIVPRPLDRSLRTILAEQSELSPIKPCQTNPFRTSTPSKEDELGLVSGGGAGSLLHHRLLSSAASVRSLGNSPVHSGRSTPREMLEPQTPRGRHSWASNSVEVPKTCSDRLGTPKTSLMDFKKLLLAHGTKSHAAPGSKMSAVEMLKKSKETRPAKEQPGSPGGNMTILDMSASPKMYSFRRIAQQGGYGGGSPTKGTGGKGAAARSNWRYNNMRAGVIATAIPEANSEEDILPVDGTRPGADDKRCSSNSSGSGSSSSTVVHANDTADHGVEDTISSFKENIFLKEDENNFMRGEVPRMAKSFAGFSTTDGPRGGKLVKDMAAKLMLRDQDEAGAVITAASKQSAAAAAAAALETAL